MSTFATPRFFRKALIAAALASAGSLALAAPYAITYEGTIGGSEFPEIIDGQSYTVTFVFDNGGTSANSQTWSGEHLTCTLWRMNDARNVTYTQNLVATPPTATSGSATTDAAGALTNIFSAIYGRNVPAGSFTASGIALTDSADWFANDMDAVFYERVSGSQVKKFDDTLVGVQMDIASWSAPVRVSGACDDTPYAEPPVASVTPVPTLGEWSLALLGLAAAGLGARRLRRRG